MTNSDNPWLESFMEKYGRCVVNSSTECLSWTFKNVSDIDVSSHETIVMDSVLTFAYGLHDMQLDKCQFPSQGLCENMTNMDGTEIRDYLLRTSFESPVNGRVEFLDNGDMGGRYGIKNLQLADGVYNFVDIGTWVDTDSGERLVINQDITWYIQGNYSLWNEDTGVPQSVCSKPCDTGQKRTVLPENPCCWSCTNCAPSEIVNHNGTVCSPCVIIEQDIFTWPNEERTVCTELEPVINRAWTTAIVILSSIGLISTIITFLIYVMNREKPLIKASSRELSYIIFTGLFLAFLTALLFGVNPSPGVCAIRRMGSPVALSLIYVSIATKTIRLYRIFRAGLKSARRPRYISPTSQVTLSLVICIAPVVWSSVWFIIIPPSVEITMPDININKIELTCAEDDIEVIGTLTWEICLIIVCCIFAFVTRKLPENYNESRFITFCVFSSLVVFSSFAPPFFTTNEAVYKASYSALGLIINATVTLVCLFVVKIYALYFVDERELNIFTQSRTRSNTRTNSMANVHSTSEGTAPPASPTRTGPQENKGFENDVKSQDIIGNLNHSSNNNNNRSALPPLRNSMNLEQKVSNDIEKGLSRSRSSSKNSSGGGGSLMHRLRGNATRVGDSEVAHTEQRYADTGGNKGQTKGDLNSEVAKDEVKGQNRSSGHKLAQIKGMSEESTSSQSDDQRVLLNVKRHNKGIVS
ncbi:metabotropic glutamate receptor 3-like [Lytechinus pictus]|uniref:metabotropic glutamate receptor 3-like n=1 Tax=Lytechinus pictus TaxID=7653 RepID=UPI0030B9E5D2